jgi:hypothetical protein
VTSTSRLPVVSGQCRSPRPPWRACEHIFRPRRGSASPRNVRSRPLRSRTTTPPVARLELDLEPPPSMGLDLNTCTVAGCSRPRLGLGQAWAALGPHYRRPLALSLLKSNQNIQSANWSQRREISIYRETMPGLHTPLARCPTTPPTMVETNRPGDWPPNFLPCSPPPLHTHASVSAIRTYLLTG